MILGIRKVRSATTDKLPMDLGPARADHILDNGSTSSWISVVLVMQQSIILLKIITHQIADIHTIDRPKDIFNRLTKDFLRNLHLKK